MRSHKNGLKNKLEYKYHAQRKPYKFNKGIPYATIC